METMKNEKQAPQQPKAANDSERGIPVEMLRFCTPNGRDLGLEKQYHHVLSRSERLEITYLPARRFFRLVESFADPKKKPRTIYVPESWGAWEPVAE